MSIYYTPFEVAQVIGKHLPNTVNSIIEPAVGCGLLLEPLMAKLKESKTHLTCVDVDGVALHETEKRFRPILGRRLTIIKEDFLAWHDKNINLQKEAFDCVIMNPPFAAKGSDLVTISVDDKRFEISKKENKVPLEVAFVIKSLSLLRDGGRLICILPSSLISNLNMQWVRKGLLEIGAIHFVHEFPKFSFKRLDARVYLCIFEKGSNSKKIVLRNHDFTLPESLHTNKKEIKEHNFRLDYNYARSKNTYSELKNQSSTWNWGHLKDVISIYRGNVRIPNQDLMFLDTADFCSGFWKKKNVKSLNKDITNNGGRRGDILIKRVGRNCSLSAGLLIDYDCVACSECILILRPKQSVDSYELLFVLRTILGLEYVCSLLERGTGASYLTTKDLLNFEVPLNLSQFFPKIFLKYKYAIQSRDWVEIKRLEAIARIYINKKLKKED